MSRGERRHGLKARYLDTFKIIFNPSTEIACQTSRYVVINLWAIKHVLIAPFQNHLHGRGNRRVAPLEFLPIHDFGNRLVAHL